MADISDYLGRITGEHSDKPKFMATLRAVLQPIVDVINAAERLPADFDLDVAVGIQLDIVGQWVGATRYVSTSLTGVYFALDTEGVGFDQGVWQGRFDPDNGVSALDDETFRMLIRARIAANHWDGTLGTSKAIYSHIFGGDTRVFIEDNQDMSMTVGIAGRPPNAIEIALLTGGHIPIKPECVRVDYYLISQSDGPLFGFDISNEFVAGFDEGSWGSVYDQRRQHANK